MMSKYEFRYNRDQLEPVMVFNHLSSKHGTGGYVIYWNKVQSICRSWFDSLLALSP